MQHGIVVAYKIRHMLRMDTVHGLGGLVLFSQFEQAVSQVLDILVRHVPLLMLIRPAQHLP